MFNKTKIRKDKSPVLLRTRKNRHLIAFSTLKLAFYNWFNIMVQLNKIFSFRSRQSNNTWV